MKKPFIILAMPRSMTAWTSCFLTIGNVFCQHEILRKDRRTDVAVQSILGQPYKYSGAACPGSLMVWQELVQRMPDANYIYIRRSPAQSLKSLAKVAQVGLTGLTAACPAAPAAPAPAQNAAAAPAPAAQNPPVKK